MFANIVLRKCTRRRKTASFFWQVSTFCIPITLLMKSGKLKDTVDLKTRYAFELADLVDTLCSSNPSSTNPLVFNNPANHTTPTNPPLNTGHPYPGFNNNMNVTVNLSIENKITMDIKNNIRGLMEGISELKDELQDTPDEEAAVALQEIEALDESLQDIQQAEKKKTCRFMEKKLKLF